MGKAQEPKVTIQNIYDALDRAKIDNGSVIFRPTGGGLTFIELDHKLVRAAVDEIATKVSLAPSGLVEFTAAEKVLFFMLIEHARCS